MGKKAFYFNMANCIGCRTCQIACKDVNDLEVGTLFRHVDSFETGAYPSAVLYHYSSSCNHCEEPACVANCPTGAMYIDEDDGTVQHDDSACIGCKTCQVSCPYSVPQYLEERGIVAKCSMCKPLRDAGEAPACVSTCLTRALEWGELEDLKAAHLDAVSDIACLPDSGVTSPAVLIDVKPAALEPDYLQKAL